MKNFVFGILPAMILLMCSQQGKCLECYTCTSYKSWEDCQSKLEKTTCQSSSTQCCKTNTNYTTGLTKTSKCNVYQKYCDGESPEDKCNYLPISSFTFSTTCCPGNLCNAGAGNQGSQALIKSLIALAVMLPFLH